MASVLEMLINTPRSVAKGLKVTWDNMIRPKTTQRYPEEMPLPAGQGPRPYDEGYFEQPYQLAPRYRGLHGLTRDPVTGDHNCIGCMACALVCPDDLISMELEKREGHSGRFPVTFTVNIGPCCFCGLCAEVCPTPMRAIVMTDLFEWATYERHGANLVLDRRDLERNGDYETRRRYAGRQWDDEGNLIGINPEEAGNPYFQFAVETGRGGSNTSTLLVKDPIGPYPEEQPAGEPAATPEVEAKAAAKAAAKAPKVPAPKGQAGAIGQGAKAATAPAAEPMEAVREAFTAAGLDVPTDVTTFDLDSLDTLIEDRKLRGQAKSAIVKAKRAMADGGGAPAEPTPAAEPDVSAPAAPAAPAAAAPAPTATLEPQAGDPLARVREVFAEAGVTAPDDLLNLELAELDSLIDDRKLRGQAKSALVKAKKQIGEGPSDAGAPPAADTAEPTPEPVTEPVTEATKDAQTKLQPGAPDDPTDELRVKLSQVLAEAGLDVPESPETDLALEDLEAIDDRKLRGQAKSALVRLKKATGAA